MNNKEITIFESLDSTNNYAMQQVHAGMAAHGDVILALQQTEGKGQHGKAWLAEKGESILMSTILNLNVPNSAIFPIGISQQFELSALVAVATREWLASYAGDNVFIKWPNDIYYNDRKAGGILIENVIGRQTKTGSGQLTDSHVQFTMGETQATNQQLPNIKWKWAVVGIGININQTQFPSDLINPVSLKQITKKAYDVIELANELNEKLEYFWEQWLVGRWQNIFDTYNQHLYKRGQPVRLRKANVVMPCTIKSVSEDGKLLIEEDEAVAFTVGEVSWEQLTASS
jgi:BirA family biotin operon repressor/biotin-[acetyl-CoA-carboxylase] ligase